ncbi:MAG TPA: hypothetical protein VFU30_05760 [Gaiellaceae bacterium]|nr:hypothetical protein [Gaiellaceae bacterium]
MRTVLRRGFVVAALAAAALVPAAAASSASGVQIAAVPLPKSALGAAGHGLPLAHDSGPVSNTEAADEATGTVTAAQLNSLGRVGGYLVDYGNPFGGASGIREIQTEVDKYRSASAARRGLEFWRRDEVKTTELKKFGIGFTVRKLGLSGIPGRHWAYAGTATIKGLQPVLGVDAQFQQGSYLLEVSVSSGSSAGAAHLVSGLARKLSQRMRLALAGRLHAKPVKLPPALKPGPPPHGPRPAALVLAPGDLDGSTSVGHRGYTKPENALDPNALSVFDQVLTSTGTYPLLTQEVLVGGSSLEAQYFGAIAVGAVTAAAGSGTHVTPVTLAGVGDNARAELVRIAHNGLTAYEAIVTMSHGSYLDFLVVGSNAGFKSADVQSLARLAAKRLDAGFR